jgi:hypothetical protein
MTTRTGTERAYHARQGSKGVGEEGSRTLARPVRLNEDAGAPGGERNQAYPMQDLQELRQALVTARRAYSTLHRALNALPFDHPTAQPLAELVAVAAKHWHEARLRLDAAKAAAAAETTKSGTATPEQEWRG